MISKLLAVMMLFSMASIAKDIEYSLEYSGDTISKSLIRNSHIKDKNDVEAIESVLIYNDLDWQKAKKLPVGKTYLIESSEKISASNENNLTDDEVESEIMSEDENKIASPISHLSYWAGIGALYHTQERGELDLYSDLSFYFTLGVIYDQSIEILTKVDRLKYSEDKDQNISEDKDLWRYELSALKLVNFETFNSKIGVYGKTEVLSGIDSINRVEFSSGSSAGIHLKLEKLMLKNTLYEFRTGFNVKKSLSSTDLDEYLSGGAELGYEFTSFGRKYIIHLNYDFADSKVSGSDIKDKTASLGLRTFF